MLLEYLTFVDSVSVGDSFFSVFVTVDKLLVKVLTSVDLVLVTFLDRFGNVTGCDSIGWG